MEAEVAQLSEPWLCFAAQQGELEIQGSDEGTGDAKA
jgi:hypothetical protein